MKVERVSYETLTPSAARAILEAILWKPEMRWVVDRIVVLKPIRYVNLKRNEVMKRIPKNAGLKGKAPNDFFADDDRAQRNAVVLSRVAYVVSARIVLTPECPPGETLTKYVEMFRRRLEKGQRFQQPYLGCREFPADVSAANGEERPKEEYRAGLTRDLGWMLLDIEYRPDGRRQPHFFEARMRDGVIDVPDPRSLSEVPA
jgi:CRISPR-associated protein Cas5d